MEPHWVGVVYETSVRGGNRMVRHEIKMKGVRGSEEGKEKRE